MPGSAAPPRCRLLFTNLPPDSPSTGEVRVDVPASYVAHLGTVNLALLDAADDDACPDVPVSAACASVLAVEAIFYFLSAHVRLGPADLDPLPPDDRTEVLWINFGRPATWMDRMLWTWPPTFIYHQLVDACDYLDVPLLLTPLLDVLANMVFDRTAVETRFLLDLPDDLSDEEKRRAKAEDDKMSNLFPVSNPPAPRSSRVDLVHWGYRDAYGIAGSGHPVTCLVRPPDNYLDALAPAVPGHRVGAWRHYKARCEECLALSEHDGPVNIPIYDMDAQRAYEQVMRDHGIPYRSRLGD